MVRRFFLTLFVFIFLFCLYYVFQISYNRKIKIEVSNNYLVKSEVVIRSVSSLTSGKNFFFIYPSKLSENLVSSYGLIKNVVIRKYLIPELKISIFVKEKNLWGRLITLANGTVYITDEGDLVKSDYINLNLLPSDLTLILINNNVNVTKNTLLILKDVHDFFENLLKIKINRFIVTDRNILEIYTDNSIKINAGYIDKSVLEKIVKLSDIFNQINKQSDLIQYIDLSLENGAVIKKLDENGFKEKHSKLFMILH